MGITVMFSKYSTLWEKMLVIWEIKMQVLRRIYTVNFNYAKYIVMYVWAYNTHIWFKGKIGKKYITCFISGY